VWRAAAHISNFQPQISDITKFIQASAQSSDFTTDSEVEDPNINKRWGKNSFKDCTDKYDCAVECGMGTDQCWKTCKGNPSVRSNIGIYHYGYLYVLIANPSILTAIPIMSRR
jgi:hypothetical protein